MARKADPPAPKPKDEGAGTPNADQGQSEDELLWQRVAQSVTPLRDRPPAADPEPRSPPDAGAPPGEEAAGAAARRTPGPVGQAAPEAPPQPPALSHGAAPGVDKRTAARLKRGKLPIEGQLDLHGMSRADGHRALSAFIQAAHAGGRRCVLVITGKGLGDDWSTGVLRQAVPEWLNEPPLRDLVLAFSYATPQHGGSGALYVLVKRKR